MGSPGRARKQGIMGPVGPPGEAGLKGQKGDMGPAGLLVIFFCIFYWLLSYCKDLLCVPYKMNDEERYYVTTLQKNAGAISRYSQQYLAEVIFHSTNEKIKFCFADPLNISTVCQYLFF